jgi:polyketide cyclase/dehydrase/lipid transport protein
MINTSSESTWHVDHTIETPLAPERLWRLFMDVAGWKRWNPGVEESALEGPFASGTWFSMKPPGQEALRSQLIAVRDGESFVDQTRVGDLVVTVAHRIERLPAGPTRITYSVEAVGPDASEIGPMIAADFPEVLASLVAYAGRVRP